MLTVGLSNDDADDSLLIFHSSDLWALGCVLYQMIAGRFAFQGLSEYLTWQKIKQLEYSFPEGFDEQAKDIVRRLLVRRVSHLLILSLHLLTFFFLPVRSHRSAIH
jgi:serine/threonine protein kinase